MRMLWRMLCSQRHNPCSSVLTHSQVRYDSRVTSVKAIIEAVEDVGFSACQEDVGAVTLAIGGMTCSACVNTVESALTSLHGIQKVSVNLLTGK